MKTLMKNQLMMCISLCVLVAGLFAPATYAGTTKAQRERVMDLVIEEALKMNFPPELALAVARVESNFNPRAISHAGARGVMQIMPKTARTEFGVAADRLFHARTNIRIGIKYLQELLYSYDNYVDIALSHYNGGSRVRTRSGSLRIIPATRKYVKKVLSFRIDYRIHPKVLVANNSPSKRKVIYANPVKVAGLDDFADTDSRIHKLLAKRRVEKTSTGQQSSQREKLIAKLRALGDYNKKRTTGEKVQYKLPIDLENRQDRIDRVKSWESY